MSEIISAHLGGQYISEAEQSHKTSELYHELGYKPQPLAINQIKKDEPTSFFDIQDKERRRQYARELAGMGAFDRHRKFLEDYVKYYGGPKWTGSPSTPKTDLDILREEYRFIRTPEDDAEDTWEKKIAKKYYDKLFKEYCLGDFTRYKEGKIGLRWRTQKELFEGKGQFVCGNKECNEQEGLRSFEVNFGYVEQGIKKNALVKIRLCPACARKLYYKHEKKKMKELKRLEKKRKQKEKEESKNDSDSESKSEKKPKKKSKVSQREVNNENDGSITANDGDSSFNQTNRKQLLPAETDAPKTVEELTEKLFKDLFQ
jgi:protein FRA10AC1